MPARITNSRFFRSDSSSSDSDSASSSSDWDDDREGDSDRGDASDKESLDLIESKLNDTIKQNTLGVFSHLITTLNPPERFIAVDELDSDDDYESLSVQQQNLIQKFHQSLQSTKTPSQQHIVIAEKLAQCYLLEYRDKSGRSYLDNKIKNLYTMLTKVMTLANHAKYRKKFLSTIQARNFPHGAYTKKKPHSENTSCTTSGQILKVNNGKNFYYFKPGARRVEEERHLIELIDYVKQQLPANLQNLVDDFIVPLYPFTVDSTLYRHYGLREFDVTDYKGTITVDTQLHEIINGGIQIDVKHLKQQKHRRHSKLFMAITVMLFGMTDLGSKDNYRRGWFIDCEERMTKFDDKSMAFDLSFLSNKDIRQPFTPNEIAWIKSIVTAIDKAIKKGYLNPLATCPRAISPTGITELINDTNSNFLFSQAGDGLSAPHVNFNKIAQSLHHLSQTKKRFSLFDLACRLSPRWRMRSIVLHDLQIACNAIPSATGTKKEKLQHIVEILALKDSRNNNGSERPSLIFTKILIACDYNTENFSLLTSQPNGLTVEIIHSLLTLLEPKIPSKEIRKMSFETREILHANRRARTPRQRHHKMDRAWHQERHTNRLGQPRRHQAGLYTSPLSAEQHLMRDSKPPADKPRFRF